ncbi:hypothetical protein [Hymenobacter sp. B81]|uniref:hypothetical protein n=1 Tax=Hymenobacter sp. B81 TaxID=3344878 RepID=UPI0037DD9E64
MDALEAYQLEKWLWTESDFAVMGWHDASVYAWRLVDQELLLDIDYIFQWNQPEVEGTNFTFWVAPATLVFRGVQNLEVDFNFLGADPSKAEALEIDGIEQGQPGEWTILFHNGYLEFMATGYSQFIRKAPSFEFGQQVSWPNRAGTSFEQVSGEQSDSFNFVEFRKTNTWRLYQLALDRARVKQQLDALLDKRAAGAVELKAFLLQKRDLQDRINYLGLELRNTRFENW